MCTASNAALLGGIDERKLYNMRRILTLVTLPALLSTIAFAESWSGTLLDASCYDKQAQQTPSTQSPAGAQKSVDACQATSSTSSFALETNGKIYKLDSSGNSKAMTALKSRADRSTGATASKQVMATVEGNESAGTIKVDRIDIQ